MACLILLSKDGANPIEPHSKVGSRSYPQTLDLAGKACKEQTNGPGSAKANGREPKTGLGRVFKSKLGCIAAPGSKCIVCIQPLLKL